MNYGSIDYINIILVYFFVIFKPSKSTKKDLFLDGNNYLVQNFLPLWTKKVIYRVHKSLNPVCIFKAWICETNFNIIPSSKPFL